MKKIILKPLEGIDFEGKKFIPFNSKKSEVIEILGNPEKETGNSKDGELVYNNPDIEFSFDKKGLCFIHCYQIDPKNHYVEILGKQVFKTPLKELKPLLEEKNGEPDDGDNSYLNISVGLYEEFTEEDVLADIEEMKKNNEYEQNKDWLQEDLEKSKYCTTLGIGKKEYYKE